jgi:hypothetical protein
MKIKLMMLTLMMCFSVMSCNKDDSITPPIYTPIYTAAFGGMLSINGSLTINIVKRGDILKFIDTGVDVHHPPLWLYPINGGSPILARAEYIEEGVTYGEIIVATNGIAISVASSQGQDDVNLTYIVN